MLAEAALAGDLDFRCAALAAGGRWGVGGAGRGPGAGGKLYKENDWFSLRT